MGSGAEASVTLIFADTRTEGADPTHIARVRALFWR